eukprot:TRINITY_DN24997_c0_g1_i1.p1 TRINITY_DN24997_c0_g1~~TRINITY_DN24997_c0_g1_i1.p1  ORF type:complete len:526 (+),score=198.78 TRINITY_DN24997_c0_g1_i1:82-1578(+)
MAPKLAPDDWVCGCGEVMWASRRDCRACGKARVQEQEGGAADAGQLGAAGLDPLAAALRGGDIIDRLKAAPETRAQCVDAGFLAMMAKLEAAAQGGGDLAEQQQRVAKVMREAGGDPRVMHALMVLQGQHVAAPDEATVRQAERKGAMPRREPVTLDLSEAAAAEVDASAARAQGNAHFKSGELAAAVAFYQRAAELAQPQGAAGAAGADAAPALGNAALCWLKLDWPERARDAASQAIAAASPDLDTSKFLFRRALAREKLAERGAPDGGELRAAVEDMRAAGAEAERRGAAAKERRHIADELRRLLDLAVRSAAHEAKRKEERANEADTERRRMQGQQLAPARSGYSGPAAEGSGYLREADFSYWFSERLGEKLRGLAHTAGGARFECKRVVAEQSKANASVTEKRGKRALYYDADLHVEWEGRHAEGSMTGVFRLYNVAHDTCLDLGGSQNSSYMYQLGWSPHGAVVQPIVDAAGELFEPVARAVDAVIAELRKK